MFLLTVVPEVVCHLSSKEVLLILQEFRKGIKFYKKLQLYFKNNYDDLHNNLNKQIVELPENQQKKQLLEDSFSDLEKMKQFLDNKEKGL